MIFFWGTKISRLKFQIGKTSWQNKPPKPPWDLPKGTLRVMASSRKTGMNLAKAQLRVPGREVFDGVLVGFVSTWGLRMPTNSIFREFVGGCFFFLRVFFFGDHFFFVTKNGVKRLPKTFAEGPCLAVPKFVKFG